MAIRMFTGTPGSGKSYDAAREVVRQLKAGRPLIANYPVNESCVKNPRSHVEYWDNPEMTPERFLLYAREHHKFGKEGQTLVIIDECQILLNCRDFGRKDRNGWVNLFAQHRKMGYDFILITQSDRFIDKQVRCLVEEEVQHRKLNNYGFGGMLLSLTMMTWFISIKYWYGGNKALIGKSIFSYNSKYEKVYDSYRMFNEVSPLSPVQAGDGGAGGNRASGGALGETVSEPDPEVAAILEDNTLRVEKPKISESGKSKFFDRERMQKWFPTYFKIKRRKYLKKAIDAVYLSHDVA